MSDVGRLPSAAELNDAGYKSGDVIIEEANLPDVVDHATALLQREGAPIYQRGDVLVAFVGDEELQDMERPYRIVLLDAVALAQLVNRCRPSWRRTPSGRFAQCNFPTRCAQVILSERRYVFRSLLAVAETPLLLPGGRYLDKPGYDAATGVLMHFDPARFPAGYVARDITDAQVDAAVKCLRALISGFPFEGDASEAAALAYLMTCVLRPAMTLAPGFAITARAPGTGKTHLQRMGARLAVNRDVGLNPWSGDETEFRKLVLSVLMNGDPIFSVDNLNGVLRSDTLCVVLTSPTYQQRLLGANEAVSVPTRVTVVANGNNLTVAGDLVRRLIVCRMDAAQERPESRRFAFDPLQLVAQDRARYVHAILTIARAYQERPEADRPSLPAFAGFGEWCELVREPLVWAGLPDPVATIEASADLDPDRLQLEAMVLAVHGLFQLRPWQANVLIAEARLRSALDDDDLRVKREALELAIRDVAEIGHEMSARRLGKWLSSVEGRIVGGLKFSIVKDKGRAGLTYQLQRAA
ncbi:MAG: hypothetical protein MUC68_02965 [Burkholderiaceae bacterium]|jgi:putative DNA primase/helicase|nr:hypothetical protein [Burkholderiaceae bacterium]